MHLLLLVVLFGNLFLNLKANEISFVNTPIGHIEENVFSGVNDTLTKLKLINTTLLVFPREIKVNVLIRVIIIELGHRITISYVYQMGLQNICDIHLISVSFRKDLQRKNPAPDKLLNEGNLITYHKFLKSYDKFHFLIIVQC